MPLKVALTIDEQIELLEGRGLDIPDTDRTARHLSNISYYRMSAYMIPFHKPNPDGSLSNDFIPGTTWNDINSLYRFDRNSGYLYSTPYDDPPTPPSWMSVELLYFNELSKICQNLKIRKAAYLGAFSILFTTYIALPFQRCQPCAIPHSAGSVPPAHRCNHTSDQESIQVLPDFSKLTHIFVST